MPVIQKPLRKPDWIRVQLPGNNSIAKVKGLLRSKHQCTVCEEAACPNMAECFNRGTATFMIMGDICTRDCQFCNVKHGRPHALDADEPQNLAKAVSEMGLKYVVITSVDRDDLQDGGASHYAACIRAIRALNASIKIEILVPDFRGCQDESLAVLEKTPVDVFNHNIETAPRLYASICPAADYERSLTLLQAHKRLLPQVPTKSGMMVGLGETNAEIEAVMRDLRAHQVDRLTLGQYLQPSLKHRPVDHYVTPEEFRYFEKLAYQLGFSYASCGPLVRSSYHAEEQSELVSSRSR